MRLRHLLWLLWTVLAIAASGAVLAAVLNGGARSYLLIGQTTSGHHQIELACDACHGEPFGGGEVLQKACMSCHGAELKAADDSHPKSKFTDPRNADRVAQLDARACITCHREHTPEATGAMAVTMPTDYCALCHQDIGRERPTHQGLGFATCASSGCHNFHDNRALYEDFLEKHLDEPAHFEVQLAFAPQAVVTDAPEPPRPLQPTDADAPPEQQGDPTILAAWAADGHSKAGVNCMDCHGRKTRPDLWIAKPGIEICSDCHAGEVETFTAGRHGMRLGEGLTVSGGGVLGFLGLAAQVPLSPMRPELARIPMAATAKGELTCNACHGAHAFDRRRAAVEACLVCHADRHSGNYKGSPHYRLLEAEWSGAGAPGSGVSCATCHLPRRLHEDAFGRKSAIANHNQNDNLRPNEKMVRSVCGACHGLGFTLDALADPALIERNFDGPPSTHVESLDWVKARLRQHVPPPAGRPSSSPPDGDTS